MELGDGMEIDIGSITYITNTQGLYNKGVYIGNDKVMVDGLEIPIEKKKTFSDRFHLDEPTNREMLLSYGPIPSNSEFDEWKILYTGNIILKPITHPIDKGDVILFENEIAFYHSRLTDPFCLIIMGGESVHCKIVSYLELYIPVLSGVYYKNAWQREMETFLLKPLLRFDHGTILKEKDFVSISTPMFTRLARFLLVSGNVVQVELENGAQIFVKRNQVFSPHITGNPNHMAKEYKPFSIDFPLPLHYPVLIARQTNIERGWYEGVNGHGMCSVMVDGGELEYVHPHKLFFQ